MTHLKALLILLKKKFNNEVKNIFLHDKGDNLKNLSSSNSDISDVTIVAKEGVVKEREMFLINGQIISSKENNNENEIIEFEQLKIDLRNYTTATVKQPKLQETSTLKLSSCFLNLNKNLSICKSKAKKEIIPILIRRTVLPFYIPVIALICSFLLLKNQRKFSKRISIFLLSFIILILTELILRYTGINYSLRMAYIIFPFIMLGSIYSLLIYKFNNETRV